MKGVSLILAIACLVFTSAVAPAFAKNNWYRTFSPDGNYLIVACKSAVQMIGESGTVKDLYSDGFCSGLIIGVADNMNSNDGVDLTDCSLAADQLVRVVQKYLQDHPEQLSKPDSFRLQVGGSTGQSPWLSDSTKSCGQR